MRAVAIPVAVRYIRPNTLRAGLGNEVSPTREGRLDGLTGVAKRVTISLVAGTGVSWKKGHETW